MKKFLNPPLFLMPNTFDQSHSDDASNRFEGWTHLELGAGNYGADGHTQKSQRKTVLQKFSFISQKSNFVTRLPEQEDDIKYDPHHQYAVLFKTLDVLIEKSGEKGVFHVNDLIPEYSQYAADRLQEYAELKGYNDVVIKSVSGDFTLIDPSEQLKKYELSKYDSVHLKNPEETFYHNGMDGDRMISTPEYRQKTRDLLQHLANYSADGLFFFPLDVDGKFIPQEEKDEFIDKDIFYRQTQKWDPMPYNFPSETGYSKENGLVYFIEKQ